MRKIVLDMLAISKDALIHMHRDKLGELASLENTVDGMKKGFAAAHFARLAEGNCRMEVSPYDSSSIAGMERVADHLVNVGYSIVNPTGSQKEG